MAVVLLQVLERTELNKLPKGIQNKLEKFVTELQNANEALKTQHERLKADSEQQYFDIEKRLAEGQEQMLSATKELQTLQEENKKLNEELCALKGIEGDSNESKPTQQQTKTKYEIEAEKRELARVLEKKTQEVENLTEDMKRLNENLAETNKVRMELQLKLDEIQSSATSVQHREKRMEQEKELLEKKIEWLTAELKTKTEELLNTERDKGNEILELQANLKSRSEQVFTLENQLTSLKETSESQSRRAEDLNSKLKQVKDEQNAMEEKYRNELSAHVKLSSLYKGAATDMEVKNQELNRAVEELSKLVKDTGEANKALEKKVSESEEQKTRLEAELKEKIKKMEKELENAAVKAAAKRCCVPSLTEDQLNSMCPSAAAIAAIVKPDMKFFDLYNAYAECQTQLQLEKQETKRVSRVLDEIVHEVESKAPVLKRQREEYESMQRSMASLCSKLEQARAEIYSLQKEKEEAKHRCDELERDKLKTERQLEDASSQLCALLVELEEARGNQVSKSDGSSADISSTSEDAGSSPLTFRSVVELQRQNQSLLGRLRDLEEEKDKQQARFTTARIAELESSVEKLQKEVELLREQRNQQKQLADSSARQRDMFKTLLTQSTGFSLPTQGQDPSSQPDRPSAPATRSTPQRAAAAEAAQTAQTKAALKQLSDAFTLYKKEKAENDRMLNETNDRLQKQLTELRSSHAKLTSQLEFSNRRYEMLQETLAAYRREIAALQERNHKMIATTQQQEHIIHTMSHELRQATEKLALEEVRVENITKERDMIRQAETRLCREKEATLAEQCNQKLLLTNIKSIQLSMERTETETRQRLNNRIEHLEKELVSMKARIEQEVSQRHALGRTMDAQLLEAKKQLETQNTLQQKTRELLRSSEQQVAALKAQLASASFAEATASSSSTSAPVTRAAGLRVPLRVRSPGPAASQQPSQSEQEQSELKGLLRSAEEQSTELAEQLKTANSTVEQYRSVVLALEDSLKKEKELRSPLESRLKETEELQRQLETRILELEKMKEQEQEEKRKAVEAVEKQVCELQRSLKASQTEQQEALERAAAAVTQEQKATQDSLLQTKLAAEAQGKYERELMLHAADVEALQQLKKTSQQHAARIRQLEEELKKTDALLQEKSAALNTVEKQLKENLANQIRRCDELGKQNNLLHQQMDEMAAKSRLQQQQQQQQQQLDLSFSEEEKTTEQILEILRFVRREKEIALAQCEAYEGEALRHKQRVEHQDRELKELQEALNSEREKMQLTTKTLAQQQEQLKRMESINALQETNKMLKMDRNKLEQELQQAQAKVTKLQSDISPLQNSLSLLSEKNSSLQADKRLLEEDLKRCRNRIQQLISQQKTGDSEERQKLTSEREAQQKRISQLVEEAAKLKTELARSNAGSNSAHSQIQALKDSMVHLMSERDTLKKDLEAKNNDIQEKNKTITQVKKIGRRYKTQFEELKAQHDKLVSESATKGGGEPFSSQEAQQELTKTQEELKKTQEELNSLREELQKKQEEAQKSQQELEEAQKDNQQTKKKLQEIQNQLTQLQSQLSQTQNQLQQSQNQLTQSQKELQQAKNQTQQVQHQFKSAQAQALTRQTMIQQIQRELQQAKDQNLTKNKELQQATQEVNNLRSALTQAENKVTELQGQLDSVQKTVAEREQDVKRLQDQLNEAKQPNEAGATVQANQSQSDLVAVDSKDEVEKLKQELAESKSREEQLKQQMAEKEEKTKKAIVGAKAKISQVNSAKEKLSQEVEELKQTKEELEVRMNALKSQYEGRILRLERELRETQAHSDSREEPQDQSGAKVSDHSRSSEQRQISLKSPAQDRGSSSLAEPPTANIRPTTSTPSPSNKPSTSAGSKATPRASIRPMVTPATVQTPTPTATVMPTTQAESQESLMSAGASVHSTSSSLMNTQTSISQPTSTQATAFVQPTQQQATSQDAGSSTEVERPSTSTSSSLAGTATSKRTREEEEEEEQSSRPESSHVPPTTKKLRLKQTIALQIKSDEEEELRNEEGERDSPDDTQELPDEDFPVLAAEVEEDSVSLSVPYDQSSQGSAIIRDVIVIDTDSESRESKEGEQTQEGEGEEEEAEEEEQEEEFDVAADNGTRGEDEGDEESREAETEEEASSGGTNPEESACGVSSGSQIASEQMQSGEGTSGVASESEAPRDPTHLPPGCSSSHLTPSSPVTSRLLHIRRPRDTLLPQLNIQPPAPELGPPHSQRQYSQSRRTSAGRGPQLTPGIGAMPFFDEDDRMVPSTPTLVVPHRTDGFAEAIHSPQVSHLPISFRFGAPEDLLPQTSASHSDLGQLASHGGLGLYESPLFLAAHDEDGGGRSVPTTPLQVAAPMTVFTETLPSDTGDNMASQSVPMVTASTEMVTAPDDGDEVFMEQEGDGASMESSLESMESTRQPTEGSSLPSTSQDPDMSSAAQRRAVTSQPLISRLTSSGRKMFLSRPGGRGGPSGRGGVS